MISFSHQYRTRVNSTPVQSDQTYTIACPTLESHLYVFKLIMDNSKHGVWIIPFNKLTRLNRNHKWRSRKYNFINQYNYPCLLGGKNRIEGFKLHKNNKLQCVKYHIYYQICIPSFTQFDFITFEDKRKKMFKYFRI